ncbi:MAG: hypothetical protein J7493_11910 [Porphyrobacter sp.]|nr:hypothetical protein [Porphyrobacter sp.]
MMAVVRVGSLPEGALDAAAAFQADVMPGLRAAGEDLAVVFPPAPHDHRAWRLAAIQDLARAAAPLRVNAIVGDEEPALSEALAFLASAPGVTGQILAVDGKSREND